MEHINVNTVQAVQKDKQQKMEEMDILLNKKVEIGKKFIGTKLNGHWIENSFKVGNEEKTFKVQVLNDGALDELKKAVGLDSIRVLLPNMAVTREYRFERLNVTIDENFVITNFTRG